MVLFVVVMALLMPTIYTWTALTIRHFRTVSNNEISLFAILSFHASYNYASLGHGILKHSRSTYAGRT